VTRYLLDTNVLSELRKGSGTAASVTAWLDGVEDDALFTSVLVTGEIRRGVELARRTDPKKAKTLEKWLTGLIRDFGGRILPIDDRVADRWGALCVDQKLPDVDGLLAATALVHGLTLVTRNVTDFKRSAVTLLNPF